MSAGAFQPPPRAGAAIRSVLLVTNPASRRAARLERTAIAAARSMGVTVDVAHTECRGHARELVRALAPGHDAVLTLGGDGTAAEAMDALAHDGPPLGVLPGGTGNLLARALGVPLSVRRAVPRLLAGDVTRTDMGHIPGWGHFAIGAGVGIDSAMIAMATAPWKRRAGVLAYIAAGTAAVLGRKRFDARITVDGRTIECRASSVLVANFGSLLGGLITLGPGIVADDGKLDVCVFDPVTIADVLRLVLRLVTRRFRPDRSLTYLRGHHIRVETDPPLPAQADGELIGSTPLSVDVAPLSSRLLVPSRQINRQ